MEPHFELRHLRSFLALSQKRNFTRAAEQVGISQGAFSTQISELETEIGVKLVVRDPTGARLTEAGVELLHHARRILRDVEDAVTDTRTRPGLEGGQLRIAHSPSHREPAIAAVAAMLSRMPALRVRVEEHFWPRIEERLREGRVDLGLVRAWAPKKGIDHEELTLAPLRLIVHPQHPLAASKTLSLARLDALAGERFVLTRKGTRARGTIDGYFEANRFAPNIAVETNAAPTALALVRGCAAVVTILPVPGPNLRELLGLPLVDLPEPVVQSTFLLWCSPEIRTEAARGFRDELRKHLGLGPAPARRPAGR